LDKRPIGIFDSGLGGLTVVKELERLLPYEKIVYFGDTGRVPYGTKDHDTLVRYALQDIRFLSSYNVKAIVIACGTISSVAFDEVSAEIRIPVIGVVDPTAKAAVHQTRDGRIGVIATSATIASGSYEKSVERLLHGSKVKSRACPLLVPLIEDGHFGRENKIVKPIVQEYLNEFVGTVDTLILGCTHYPLLSDMIEDILPGVTLIDAGCETAKAAVDMLKQNELLTGEDGGCQFYVSDSTDKFARLAGIFLEHPVTGRVEKVEIEKY
jgi:glutamate racemase